MGFRIHAAPAMWIVDNEKKYAVPLIRINTRCTDNAKGVSYFRVNGKQIICLAEHGSMITVKLFKNVGGVGGEELLPHKLPSPLADENTQGMVFKTGVKCWEGHVALPNSGFEIS